MASIQELSSTLSQNFTISEGVSLAKPLGLFIIALAVYAFFIFKFYKFLARREIFKFKSWEKETPGVFGTIFHGTLYILKHLIIFPLFLFFWVLVLSFILAFLAKNTPTQTILLISVSLVGVIRVMAYYNEDLSKDLAKMMPFALLGVFLVDVSYFSSSDSFSALLGLVNMWRFILYYLVILVFIEFTLRILYFISKQFKSKSQNREKANKPL